MTFQERLAKLQQRIEGGMPSEFVDIMHRATRELEESGIQANVIEIGDQVPEFQLPNQNNELIAVKDLYSNGPLIITFYRGIWCPYCNLDLSNLKKYQDDIVGLGGQMISISPELPEYNASIIERHALPFDLLTDAGNQVAEMFGLKFTLPGDLKALYRDEFDINLETYNNDPSWTLPMPGRFVVDNQGVIQYAESSPNYTRRPDPDDLIDVLSHIQHQPNA